MNRKNRLSCSESSDSSLTHALANLSPAAGPIETESHVLKLDFLKKSNMITRVDRIKSQLDMSDLLVLYLEQIGVEYIFGVPGGAIEPLYNAMARSARRGGIRPVVARHETGAAFMAQGYAKETGRLGVCCTTTGPGATNALTGVASAYYDEVPMLLITGQTAQDKFGRGAFQDSSRNGVDILGIFQHCTRYSTIISDAAQFESELATALMIANDSPSGPVHITIPIDIMRQSLSLNQPSFNLKNLLRKPLLVDLNSIEELAAEIDSTKKIVILIGEGCTDSVSQIVEFAECTNALFVTTPCAKGLINPYHSHYRGVLGFAGHSCALEALDDPLNDFIFIVGTALGEWDISGWDPNAVLNRELIHIDSSMVHLARSLTASRHVRGDIKTSFIYLNKKIMENNNVLEFKQVDLNYKITRDEKKYEQPLFFHSEVNKLEFVDDKNGLKPQQLMLELSKKVPNNARFFADIGNSTAWAVHYLFLNTSSRLNTERCDWFGTSIQFASMGWAIGNAIGAAIGNNESPVICITGDGSVLMNGQEFTVAVAEKLSIIFVVLNDSGYGMVKHGQRLTGAERIAFELPQVDFCSFAIAMGGNAYKVRTLSDLHILDFDALYKRGGPTLLDVYIDPEEVPPMGLRAEEIRGVDL